MRTLRGVAVVLSLGLLVFPSVGLPWLALLVFGGASLARRRGRSVRAYLRELDDVAAAGESALVAVALAAMTIVVFLDVVWRTSHSVSGATAWVFAAALLAFCLLGALTARWPGAGVGKRLLTGAGTFVIACIGIRWIHAAPHGFGWSQRVALVLLLWVGLLGASLASKWGRHIQVDAVRRVVPPRWRRTFEILAELVTLTLLALLTWLAREYVLGNWSDWARSDGRSAVFESVPIPYWAASFPIVIGFALMLARSFRALVEGPVQAELLVSLGGSDSRAEPDGAAGPNGGTAAP